MVGDTSAAEDLASETFLKAFRSIDRYKTGSFTSWLYTIARYSCLNYLQRKWLRSRPIYDDGRDDAFQTPSDDLSPEALALLAEIGDFINGLPDKQSLSAKLFYIEGCSYDEIAEITQQSAGAVKSHLQHALRKLRNQFRRAAGDE
jgi:RNA polymerase sigma-70 factor (ECF subfamily)